VPTLGQASPVPTYAVTVRRYAEEALAKCTKTPAEDLQQSGSTESHSTAIRSRRGRLLDEFRLSPRAAYLLGQGLRATRPPDVQ
jgi:hypothetical protein